MTDAIEVPERVVIDASDVNPFVAVFALLAENVVAVVREFNAVASVELNLDVVEAPVVTAFEVVLEVSLVPAATKLEELVVLWAAVLRSTDAFCPPLPMLLGAQ